jgi:hypothetical protein
MTRTSNNNDVARPVPGYVGTLVGESTSQEFRLAVAQGSVREQDLVAVDADLHAPDGKAPPEKVRVWAKVQRIERINPLFPAEAGHELAETRTNPLDTILSFSRELITAVCRVLGMEAVGASGGKLDHLRYPPQPATSAYRPGSADIARVVLGDLRQKKSRALDLAALSNRPDVDVLVDGHAIVTRHLAILAMTGAGKSWTARRLIEQLAGKNYPIVIFDPHGDYTGLADVPGLGTRVRRYYAQFPIFEQPPETVATVVENLGWALANTHRSLFDDFFKACKRLLETDSAELARRAKWLSDYLGDDNLRRFGLRPNLFALASLVQAVVGAGLVEDAAALDQLVEWTGCEALKVNKRTAGYLSNMPNNLRKAARRLHDMEQINRKVAGSNEPLPNDRRELVRYGQVSVVALAGYTSDFQATIYSLIAGDIFAARVSEELKLPALLVLEEAHYFAPGHAGTPAEQNAIGTTKQIAQEGRKFGVGLVLISQRPSRLDETTLSQCNSYVIMRLVNPADQNFVRKVIETLGEDEARMLPDLDVGEALLAGQMINFPVLARIKAPQSKGEREEEDAFAALEKARRL